MALGKRYTVHYLFLLFLLLFHDDVNKWKRFPRYWPFVMGTDGSPVNSPHKGQWRGALMFSLTGAWTNGWANHRDAADLRRHRTHYDVTVVFLWKCAGRFYLYTFGFSSLALGQLCDFLITSQLISKWIKRKQFPHLAIAVSPRLEVESSGHAWLDGCNFQRKQLLAPTEYRQRHFV